MREHRPPLPRLVIKHPVLPAHHAAAAAAHDLTSSFEPTRRNTEQQGSVSLGPAGQDCVWMFARSDTDSQGFTGFTGFTGTVGESRQGLRHGMAGHSAQLERKRQPVCHAFDDSLFAAFRGCKQTTH